MPQITQPAAYVFGGTGAQDIKQPSSAAGPAVTQSAYYGPPGPPPALSDLTAEDGTTLLTAEDGTTQLTAEN